MKASSIEIKKSHGKLVVLAIGRTGKGRRYIKETRVLDVPSVADKKFKAAMAQAVVEMLGSEAADIQYGLDLANKEG